MLKINIKKIIENSEANLKIQIGILLFLGIISLTLSYFSQSSFIGTNSMNLGNEIYVALNQLYTSTYFISTVALNSYKKARTNTLMFIAYVIILLAYILQRNYLIIFLMSFYLFKLLKSNKRSENTTELRKGESIIAFSSSLIVLFTSIIISYINI